MGELGLGFYVRIFSSIALGFVLTPAAFGQHRHCLGPGDFDADHVVGLTDLQLLSTCMGGPTTIAADACPLEIADSADIDLDVDNDLADFAAFARRFEQIYFDYGPPRTDKEAEFHAMLLTSQLRAPDREYERISRDLALIRSEYPDLAEVHDEGSAPNQGLVVRVYSTENQTDFLAINEYFVFFSIQDLGIETYYVDYCDVLLNFSLAQIYLQSGEVRYAFEPTPACSPVCCRNRVVVRETDGAFRYEFYYYWDSPPGSATCGCRRVRILDVNKAGNVNQHSCEDSCLPDCP